LPLRAPRPNRARGYFECYHAFRSVLRFGGKREPSRQRPCLTAEPAPARAFGKPYRIRLTNPQTSSRTGRVRASTAPNRMPLSVCPIGERAPRRPFRSDEPPIRREPRSGAAAAPNASESATSGPRP
jgi:hypothetical protein